MNIFGDSSAITFKRLAN